MRPHENEWRFSIPASLEAAEEIFRKFRSWHAGACRDVPLFSSELLFREALTNSVVHGSSGDSSKKVFCVLRPRANRLVIAIRDQGEGFDWRTARHHQADLEDSHGRGMEIYRTFASAVRFNARGNSLVLIQRNS